MQWAAIGASIHNLGNMRNHECAVVDNHTNNRSREDSHDFVDSSITNEQAEQPFRSCQQSQRRNDVRENHVLHHVHGVQVLLRQVMHGPVTGQPQQRNHDNESDLLSSTDDLAFRCNLGAKHAHGVHECRDETDDQYPHFWVELVPPGVRVCCGFYSGEEHRRPNSLLGDEKLKRCECCDVHKQRKA